MMSERIEAILNLVGQGKGVTIEGERLMADEVERLRADNDALKNGMALTAAERDAFQGAHSEQVKEIERLRGLLDIALTAIEFVLGGVVDAAVSTEDLDPGIAVDLIGMMEAALSEANRAFTPFRNDQPSMGDGK